MPKEALTVLTLTAASQHPQTLFQVEREHLAQNKRRILSALSFYENDTQLSVTSVKPLLN